MSKKNEKSLLNMIERERHRVAATATQGDVEWSQAQPNRSVAKMFVIMLAVHILVIAGLIIYDFATGGQRKVAKASPLPIVQPITHTAKAADQHPLGKAITAVDPRNDTPTVSSSSDHSQQTVAAATASPPLPVVNHAVQSTPVAAPVSNRPVSGMPTLSLGTTKVDLPDGTGAPMGPIKLPTANSPHAIGQPSIEPPKPVTIAKAEPVYTPPSPKAAPANTPPKQGDPEPRKPKVTQSKPAQSKPAPVAPAKVKPAVTRHTVGRGDTLSAVAKRYGVSRDALIKANNLKNPDQVVLGSRLIIPNK